MGSQVLPECRTHVHPFGKGRETHFFIGRMGVVIRQPEPKQESVRPQHFLEFSDDGDGTSLTHQDGPLSESHFKSIHRCLGIGAIWGRHIGLAAVPRLEVEAHGLGADGLQVPFEQATFFWDPDWAPGDR